MSKAVILIVVVDDEKDIVDMLDRHLRFSGFETVKTYGVNEALAVLSERKIGIVVSYIMMSNKLGTDLIREIKKNYTMTKAIMITGYVTLENALTCMRLGTETCIFKPIVDMGELDSAVENGLNW